MQVKTHISAGGVRLNHSQPVQIRTKLRAGAVRVNHAGSFQIRRRHPAAR
jgi:hypothetical protein